MLMLSSSRTASATIRSGRLVSLLIALAAMTAWPAVSQAQFGRDRGGGDRGEQMRRMMEQMRSRGGDRGGSSDDRRERMQSFFSQMGQSRGGDRGGSSRGGSRGAGREGSRGGSDRGRRGTSKKRAKPKPKPRMTLDLPEEYADQDRDNDGQLGLYEWKLSAIAEFRSFDINADGFLTPRELLTGGSDTDEETASSDDRGSSKKDSDDRGDSKRRGSDGRSSTKTVSTKAAASGGKSSSTRDATTVRRAKLFFKGTDKDKDGKLTLEEWGQSRMTRSIFTKAKVKVKLPIDEEGFIAIFPATTTR